MKISRNTSRNDNDITSTTSEEIDSRVPIDSIECVGKLFEIPENTATSTPLKQLPEPKEAQKTKRKRGRKSKRFNASKKVKLEKDDSELMQSSELDKSSDMGLVEIFSR